MIGLLQGILATVGAIGQLVLYGVVSAWNLIMDAIGLAVTAALALLPSMSDAPALGHPGWLGWLSWFYPVGGLLAGLTVAVTMWIAFLAVRYILRLARAI